MKHFLLPVILLLAGCTEPEPQPKPIGYDGYCLRVENWFNGWTYPITKTDTGYEATITRPNSYFGEMTFYWVINDVVQPPITKTVLWHVGRTYTYRYETNTAHTESHQKNPEADTDGSPV